MYQVLLFLLLTCVRLLNIGSGDKTGKSVGTGDRIISAPPNLSLEKPSSTELPKDEASHREFTKAVPSGPSSRLWEEMFTLLV